MVCSLLLEGCGQKGVGKKTLPAVRRCATFAVQQRLLLLRWTCLAVPVELALGVHATHLLVCAVVAA